MENRSEKRHDRGASIVFSLFSSHDWHTDFAEVVNFSNSGMLFKSKRPLHQGATIYIRTEANSQPEAIRSQESGQVRTVTLAQVRWCKPVTENTTASCFGIGVRYL